MTDMNLLADSYDAAADYIEQHGWLRGSLYPTGSSTGHITQAREEKPRACTLGAGFAVGIQPEDNNVSWLVPPKPFNKFSAITMQDWVRPLEVELDMEDVPYWNDTEAKNAGEVADLLRMTALKIRMGNIGDNPREYEFQPMPTTEPVVEPAAPQPVKEPQPA